MNKEEILAKAQQENKDEMEVYVKDKSLKWTYIVMVLAAAVFTFIRAEKGEPMMDLCATVSASVTAGMIYRFVKTKEKSCLIIGLITLCTAVVSAIRFFMGY